jgi:thiol-disulfide isomerase/thioredoxin
MKKIYILTSILVLLFVGISILIEKTIRTNNHKKQVLEQLKIIPTFETYNMDSLKVSHTEFNNKPTVIVYFNTECEHCQYEATQIVKYQDKFKDINLYMLSAENIAQIKAFAHKMGLDKISNLEMGKITVKESFEVFAFTSIPDILIYNASGELQKHFKGETKIEAILKYL